MPRVKRQESYTGLYHVFVRGINKEKIFDQVREKLYFKRIIKKYIDKYEIEIHAYCIMSNHAHLIIKSDEQQKLSFFMSNILAEYAQYYNYKHNRNGHVFQNRFGSECIESEKYYWNCIKYIHMNPVKANLVYAATDYKYSSFGDYKRKRSGFIHENAISNYRERFQDWESYLNYHGIENEMVFLGMKEEVYVQKKDMAKRLLWEIKDKEKVEEARQIIEEPMLREKYLEKLRSTLKLSKTETRRLYTEIKREYLI